MFSDLVNLCLIWCWCFYPYSWASGLSFLAVAFFSSCLSSILCVILRRLTQVGVRLIKSIGDSSVGNEAGSISSIDSFKRNDMSIKPFHIDSIIVIILWSRLIVLKHSVISRQIFIHAHQFVLFLLLFQRNESILMRIIQKTTDWSFYFTSSCSSF